MPSRPVVFVLALTAASQSWAQAGGSRVEEEANRPMRMILEAAKIKGRAKPAEPPPAPVKPVAAAARAASSPAPAPVAATTATTAPQPAPVALPASAPEGPPQSTVVTVDVDAAPRAVVPEVSPASVPRAEPEAVPIENLPPLKLLNVVEPVTPRALLGKLRGEIRVDVAFTVAADGSVTEPAVRSSSHPQMNAAVLEAVGQWRYQPIASPREHAVQVVLRPGS